MNLRFIPDIGSTHAGNKEECFKAISNAAALGLKDCKFQLLEEEQLKNGNILLPWDWVPELIKFGEQQGINVFFSCWSKAAADFLLENKVKTLKLATSTNIYNIFQIISASQKNYEHGFGIPFIEYISSTDYEKRQFHHSFSNEKYDIKHLFCVPEYPVLYKIDFSILKNYDGFSDHTLGFEQTKEALIKVIDFGKKEFIIEKHVSQTDCNCPDNNFAVKWDEVRDFFEMFTGYIQTRIMGRIDLLMQHLCAIQQKLEHLSL